MSLMRTFSFTFNLMFHFILCISSYVCGFLAFYKQDINYLFAAIYLILIAIELKITKQLN